MRLKYFAPRMCIVKLVLFSFLILSSLSVFATYQVEDELEYNGQQYFIGMQYKDYRCPIWYFPLESYIKQKKINLMKKFEPYGAGMCTACWRGYVGDYQIKDGKFFLLHLNMDPWAEQGIKEYPLSIVNPKWKSPVFADWYTGSFLLCRRIAFEWHCLVPVYKVKIKQGKVQKIADSSHWLRNVAMKSERMKNQLAAYRKQKLKPYRGWDKNLCRDFFQCIDNVKPGMTLTEVEKNMKQFDLDNKYFKAAKKLKCFADGILRFYVFKLKKDTVSPEDIFLDLVFKADLLQKMRIVFNTTPGVSQ